MLQNSVIDSGEFDPQDILKPRSNILHFYGIGGIGKSEVLDRLYYRSTGLEKTNHWSTFKHAEQTISCFYDLSRHNSPTPEGLLLSIRQNLASKNISCYAFDLLIARYWALNHPSESLDSYLSKRTQQIMSNWDTLEPLAYMMDKVVIFLLASTGFLLTNNIAKIKSVVRSIIRTLVFKLLGINVKQYEDIVERIKTR